MANELDAMRAENQRLIKLEGALRRSCETLKGIAKDESDGQVEEIVGLYAVIDNLKAENKQLEKDLEEEVFRVDKKDRQAANAAFADINILTAENTEVQRKFDSLMEAALRKQVELDESKEGILHETLDDEYVVCMSEEKWAEVKKETERFRDHAQDEDISREIIKDARRTIKELREENKQLRGEYSVDGAANPEDDYAFALLAREAKQIEQIENYSTGDIYRYKSIRKALDMFEAQAGGK